MSLYQPVSNTGSGGGVQLVDIGNTGSNEVQLDQGAIMKGVSKFVLAVPGGQPASAVNILQQIANSAAAEKQQNLLITKPDRRKLNHRMTMRAQQTKAAATYHEPDPPPAPKARRRSRKQKLSQQQTAPIDPVNKTSLSASLPQLKQEDIVLVPVIEQVQLALAPREKRKRKSPMRSHLTDTFGEPEFTEMYYFEESEGEEDDSYAGNVLHLMKERQRRREMTGQFEALGRLVTPRETKPSRNIVLRKSTKLVKDLTAKGVSLRVQKNLLQEINVGLRQRMAELLGVSTHINYESEEEEVEKVGGYNGYKSSSSDPDNDDVDDDDLDWGGSIEDEDDDDYVDDDVKQEGDVECQDDFKVELPDDGEGDDFDGGGEGDDEGEDDDDSRMTGLKIKQEPESEEDEMEPTAVLSTHSDDDDDNNSQQKLSVRIKQEIGFDDDSADMETSAAAESASAAVESSTEPSLAIMPSPKSSVHQSNQRSEDDDEVYDRYDRVKIEPRSPVRRALFTDSESQDSTEDRVLDENVLVAATLDMDSLQAVKTELDEDDGGDLLAQDLDNPLINLDDPGLLSNVKTETDDDDSNF